MHDFIKDEILALSSICRNENVHKIIKQLKMNIWDKVCSVG